MTDPFAMALGALFGAAGSVAAVYTPASGGAAVPLRAIVGKSSTRESWGGGEVVAGAPRAEIQRSDLAAPASGDRLDVLGPDELTIVESFTVAGEPTSDVEGLTWLLELQPA